MRKRNIRAEERILLHYLLGLIQDESHAHILPEEVIELDDGGMGSLRLGAEVNRRYGSDLIQVKYIDEDDVLVIITLTQDEMKNLFELEMWKVDFSALKQYPTPDKVTLGG